MYDRPGENDLGGFLYPMLLVTVFICFVFFMIALNFNQLTNIKETVDQEFKNAVSAALIEYTNDKFSSDKMASLKTDDIVNLQSMIKSQMENALQHHGVQINIKKIDIKLEDRIYVRYEGTIPFSPIATKNFVINIFIKGRSKVQRFDM